MNAFAPAVILNEPQLAENIGAVARVMANFGLSDLRLVRPRDGWPQERAWASASGAIWPLDEARVFDRLEDALADLRLVMATTARPREALLPVLTPREAVAKVAAAIAGNLTAGLLFGGERAGLSSDDVALAHGLVTVPVDTAFRSLNLAQAVAINAYEWRLTRSAAAPEGFGGLDAPAGHAEVVGFFKQLEGELDAAGFFHPPEKRPSMVRNLRIALGRANLSSQEVRTLRGVVTALSKGRGRALARLAGKRTADEPQGD